MNVASSDKHFGKEEEDLFALSELAQCLLLHPAPLGIEALAHPWPKLHFYISSRIKFVALVMSRLQESKDMEALGLAPEWGLLMFMVSLLRFRTPSTRKLYALKCGGL